VLSSIGSNQLHLISIALSEESQECHHMIDRSVTRRNAAWLVVTVVLATASLILPASSGAQGLTEPTSGRAKTTLSAGGKYIDERIADFMKENGIPGLSMAIVQAPYIPRSAGYGSASTVNDQIASTKTMWNIGPITQGYTAVAVFQLFESGKLDLQDPISKYVSGLPKEWARTTIFELLQHASGIPDYRASARYAESNTYRPVDLLAMVVDQRLLFPSGEQVRMSATDNLLLGLVIEKASGMSFHDFVTHFQIEPLHLKSTMFAEDLPKQAHLDLPKTDNLANEHVLFKSEIPYIDPVEPAVGYQLVQGQLVAVAPTASESLFAFGSLWSSAEDVSIWDIALAGTTLVHKAENHTLIYAPTHLKNGTVVPAMAGWEFTRHPGFMEVKGYSPGFSSYLSRFTAPSELVCVTLLANKEGVDLTSLARDIAEAYKTGLGPQVHNDHLSSQESKFSVDDTVTKLQSRLKTLDVPVFAVFDHAGNAQQVGLQLRPTKVIVFGNAKVGTKLMIDNQAAAIDLPLRMSVWEDEMGRVWVTYPNTDQMARDYSIDDPATVAALRHFVESLIEHSVNVYSY
jgi:CubicO group peptidase (beta-lactamase class C family)/uncharacterized protein (DUF302 family)